MEEQNPYQRPQTHVADAAWGELQPASRLKRLGAAILDTIIALVIVLPMMMFGGYFDTIAQGGPGLAMQLAWGVLGFAVFVAVHFIPLKNNGQTWGKKAVGVRIVDMQGQNPGLGVLLGRRYLFSGGIGLVPFVGGLLSIANVLFIFRGDRRCLHDLVANTQVVEAN
ncbi:RDD family protein [Lysobacter sp.]|uniref:RDD family protein n=1 Tax=Lysobacter sp. TaxID=72226 RepID=UPI002D28A5F9|nr:RDD family protein [Lysobacter sp.]HZX76505.1 RDD family protein [Lysobacter sp.]